METKQREIKFRAWDGEKNEMIHEFGLLADSKYAILQTEEGNLFCGGNMTNGDWQEPILMQFTGLFDKNGKEIYEDDIVKFRNHTGESEKCLPIKFDPYRGFRPYLKGYGGFEWSHLNSEVIGNIYQTPDLIK